MARDKPLQKNTSISVGGIEVPVTISFENRRNARVSAATNCVYLRVPLSRQTLENPSSYVEWMYNWLVDLNEKKPGYLKRYLNKPYDHGVTIVLMSKAYRIIHTDKKVKRKLVHLDDSTLYIHKPSFTRDGVFDYDAVKRSVIRELNKKIGPELEDRVGYINERTYKFPVDNVQVKYTKSRWGSCSNERKISLSSRLFLVDEPVRDYVIIHELAHLQEFDHSKKFWKLVERADPGYRKKERWLKKFGHLYDF